MGSQNCIFESYGDDGIWETPLKRILDCAAKCAQCQFVIAAIDTYAPGWIIQNRSEGWTEFYTPINAFVLHEVSSKKKSGKFHILLEPNVNTSEDTKEYARFACLSYRWGADPEEIVRTTSANMAEHAKGIEVHKLPKTVIDAVIVCRELCIPYLWVDALCIIQRRADMAKDGVAAQDWLEEGSRMDDIYGLSHLTIYAEAATTCKESFLGAQIRGSEAYQRRVVNVRAPNGQAAFVREGGMSQYQSNEKSEMSQQASESGKACKDEYLAGLWRSTLLDSLPWHASGSNKYRRLDGGVPTWSWASLDGSVVFRPSGSLAGDIHGNSIAPRHYDAEVVDIKISLVSPDIPTGNVTAGQLGLKGPLLPVQVAVVSDQTGAQWYQERGRMEMPERFPIILARTSRLASSVVVLDADNVEGILDLSHGGKNTACWIHDKCSCQGTVSCFDDASGFFALCLYGTNESGQMKNRQVVFLLLKKRSTGDYERAGVGFSGPTATESYWRPGVQGTEFAIFQGGEEKVAVTIV
ncbi:hypothetical protein ACJ41O_005793 [Fusarium nematophilum]